MQLEVDASLQQLRMTVLKREFGLRIVENGVVPCSMWDLRAILSPRIRVKNLEITPFSK